MGWRFRKSIKIAPGIKINIGKKGVSSLSVGPRGAHINIGKNGTNLSTGIPGTGIYNVTRLDKPAGSGMTQCPYCGHRMRKQWDACPKCHAPLLQKSEQQNIEPKNITPPSASDNPPVIDAEYAESKPQKTSKGSLGCGCLIIILIFMMIGSCMSGAGHKATPPASSSPASITTSSGNDQKPEEKIPIVPVSTQETKAATPAAPPAPTQTTEKKVLWQRSKR